MLEPPSSAWRPPAGRAAARRLTGRRHAILLIDRRAVGDLAAVRLLDAARAHGVEPVELGADDELHAVATRAVRAADVVGLAGATGEQTLVANVAMDHGVPYVWVPIAHGRRSALGPRAAHPDVGAALEAFAAGVDRAVDVAFVNGRMFVEGVALEAAAAAEPLRLHFLDGEGGQRDAARRIVVTNRPGWSAPRDGRTDSRAALLRIVARLAARDPVHGGRLRWSAPTFGVDAQRPLATRIDGRLAVLQPPLRFKAVAGALMVRLPRALADDPARPAVQPPTAGGTRAWRRRPRTPWPPPAAA
jgi:hypothetical protein